MLVAGAPQRQHKRAQRANVALRSARQCGGHSHVLVLTVTSMTGTVALDGRTRHGARSAAMVTGALAAASDGRNGKRATRRHHAR
jgi:hypothetical protein